MGFCVSEKEINCLLDQLFNEVLHLLTFVIHWYVKQTIDLEILFFTEFATVILYKRVNLNIDPVFTENLNLNTALQ